MTIRWVNSDAGAGADDGTSEANGFLTISQAAAVVAAGDHTWVKKASGYVELVTLITAGTKTAPIVWEGYETSTGDGVKITIDGSGSNNYGFTTAISTDLLNLWKNTIVTNCTGNGWNCLNADKGTLINCESTNNNYGVRGDNGWKIARSVLAGNVNYGAECDSETISFANKIYSNGIGGINSDNIIELFSNYYGLGSGDIAINVAVGGMSCVVCVTIDGENTTSTGIKFNNDFGEYIVANNILYDLGTGLSLNSDQQYHLVGYNLINSNTIDYNNTVNTLGNDVTGAPAFTDETGDDYTLDSASPAIAAGLDAGGSMDIGAFQTAAGGGGGGGCKQAGASGGMVG